MYRHLRIFLFFIGLLAAPAAPARELYIAAAADLVYCLKDLNAAFQAMHPDAQLIVTTGSSGNFFAQIQNGAPFEVFMSADLRYPRELVDARLADGSTMLRYAIGRLAIWSVDPKVDVAAGLRALTAPGVRRVAIASPDHAPYGVAARSAMQKEGIWDALQPKLVMGENIVQTAQFVQSGNVDAGIVALSLLKAPALAGVGKFSLVPLDRFPTMDQGAVVTGRGSANPLARDYVAFLATPQARAIFDRYGFLLP